ncbi:hypothetical protein [Actinacidiphila yeochonensis]|uniref:hypothetical protein n=1 Tax=Actinacidiphila yeochonensis TaxID=89050 RepID=UPI0006896DCD|nr:hypothetical protein [Actinacidiphila yeochonensis]
MPRRTTLTTAATTLTAATLLLTACGGGGSDNKIASSPTTTTSAPPPTTAAPTTTPAAAGAPTFDFPSDVKVVIDPDTTGDATKDAILRDQGYGLDATYVAVSKLDKNQPLFNEYLVEDAAETWSEAIDGGKKDSATITGTVHFYDRKVTVTDSTTAAVTFCEDQRYAYDKNTKTGKTAKTAPSADSFIFHTSRMLKASDGTWQTSTYNSQRGAAQCQQ